MSNKKKLIKALSAITALTLATSTGALVKAAIAGDVNGDGLVGNEDIKSLGSFLVGSSNNVSTDADITGDTLVNVFDMISLKRTVIQNPASDAKYIHLNSTTISTEGNGMELSAEGNVVTITSAGTYYVDGTLTEGQIYVNAADIDQVTIILNGVDITCNSNAPIYVMNADKTVISLADGTTNTITDGTAYTDAEADSAIYAKDDLTFNGSGSLTVNSNYLYSISCNDDLKINSGNIIVKHNSVDESGAAVKGKKSVTISGGNLKVTCAADDTDTGADAIISNDSTDATVGYILISGGNVNINAKGGDAIKSKNNYVEITGGVVTAKAENDAIQAETNVKISGNAEVYAYGKRSFKTGTDYTVDITGGNVVATSNEEFTNTAGITVNSMILNYTEKLDKQEISIQKNGETIYFVKPDKKYTYAMICNDSLSNGTYNVYTGGVQMSHDTAAADGEFVTSGTISAFNTVTAISSVVIPVDNTITLSSSGIIFAGSGAEVSEDNNTVTISQPGTYNVTGEMEGGQIIVDVDKTAYVDATVELSLQGMSLTNTSTSPIYVASVDDKCSISAKKGTTNTISDGSAAYTNADDDSGAIYSKDDLNFKGKGTLIVNGNYQDAIVSKDDIKLNNGTIQVTAADDGIRGKDSVTIGDPEDTDYSTLNVTINAKGGDGIKSTETDTTTGKGFITSNGGTVNITAYSDGMHASQLMNLYSGEFTIKTTAQQSSSGGSSQPGGGGGGSTGGSTTTDDISAKGLKAGCTDDAGTIIEGTLNITGGNFNIDSTDDSLHGTDVNISGGNITSKTGDDGVHADDVLTITDGTINVTDSYEGLEAYDIEIKGGNIKITSSDDGLNAAGGDGSASSNPGGWGHGNMSTSTGVLNISGGYLFVRAEGDGIDSNGNITISGGTSIVCGPTSGGNGIFDIGDNGSTFSHTGGVILGIGSSDMAVYPSTKTYITGSGSISANKLISVADSSGNTLGVITVPSDININGMVIYASTDVSSSYSVYSGGTFSGTLDENGYGTTGTISGATVMSSSSSGGR